MGWATRWIVAAIALLVAEPVLAQERTSRAHGFEMGRPIEQYGPLAPNENRWQEATSPGDAHAIAGTRYFVRGRGQTSVCEIVAAAAVARPGDSVGGISKTMTQVHDQVSKIIGRGTVFGDADYYGRLNKAIAQWRNGTLPPSKVVPIGSWGNPADPSSVTIFYASVDLIAAPNDELWVKVLYFAANIGACRSPLETKGPRLFD